MCAILVTRLTVIARTKNLPLTLARNILIYIYLLCQQFLYCRCNNVLNYLHIFGQFISCSTNLHRPGKLLYGGCGLVKFHEYEYSKYVMSLSLLLHCHLINHTHGYDQHSSTKQFSMVHLHHSLTKINDKTKRAYFLEIQRKMVHGAKKLSIS